MVRLKAHCVCDRVTVGTWNGACTCMCTCKCDNVYSCVDTCECSSAHSCGCVVDGRDTMVAL